MSDELVKPKMKYPIMTTLLGFVVVSIVLYLISKVNMAFAIVLGVILLLLLMGILFYSSLESRGMMAQRCLGIEKKSAMILFLISYLITPLYPLVAFPLNVAIATHLAMGNCDPYP